jgi:hypothetical protein
MGDAVITTAAGPMRAIVTSDVTTTATSGGVTAISRNTLAMRGNTVDGMSQLTYMTTSSEAAPRKVWGSLTCAIT